MATKDIKSLLDDIIGDKDSSSKEDGTETVVAKALIKPTHFNSDNFREKLSLCVLKDIICAMMHDETKDLDEMIDSSIMKHIHDDYRGTCFGYLCRARDRIQNPILGNIVQEIENKTRMVKEGVEEGKPEATDAVNNPEQTTADILDTVNNYDQLRALLKEKVTNDVVNDVAKVITKSNDAPVFDNIDTKLKKIDNTNDDEGDKEGVNSQEGAPDEANAAPEDTGGTGATTPDVTPADTNAPKAATESLIMRMTGTIVTEYALNKTPISTDEGINRAIVIYCLGEMDALFDYDRSKSIVARYL